MLPCRNSTQAARQKPWSSPLTQPQRRCPHSVLISSRSLTLRTTHCFWSPRIQASSSPWTLTLSESKRSYIAGPIHTLFTFFTGRCQTLTSLSRPTCTMETELSSEAWKTLHQWHHQCTFQRSVPSVDDLQVSHLTWTPLDNPGSESKSYQFQIHTKLSNEKGARKASVKRNEYVLCHNENCL